MSGDKSGTPEKLAKCPFGELIERHGNTLEITGFEGIVDGGTPLPRASATHVHFGVYNGIDSDQNASVQVGDQENVRLNWYFTNYTEVSVTEDDSQITITGLYGTGKYSVTVYK